MPKINSIPDSQLSLIHPFTSSDKPQPANSNTNFLMDLVLGAANDAREIDLVDVSARIRQGPKWPNIWPGEHYKLLAALVKRMRPNLVVEIGTFLGVSSLVMKKYIPRDGRVVTFDVIPWQSFEDTCFQQSDFDDPGLVQVLGDLAQPNVFEAHRELMASADIIFLDGPKNRSFERAFLQQLMNVNFYKASLLVIDDIRLWNMLDLWREIELPKLDVTSFGHYSGTGLVLLAPHQASI
ncbi:MAG: hypothetical protein Q8O37_13865 [Sulfuricellaceae bacterium]|nr:hypothetical protein [Sulfuricellaceae bacterium]